MKTVYLLGVVIALTGVLVLFGCKAAETKRTAEKQYPIKGKVTAVNQAKASVKLDHDDIPGLMQAMRMEFGVANPEMLAGLEIGDQVVGRMKVESGKYIITELQKR